MARVSLRASTSALDLGLHVLGELVVVVGEELLGRVDELVALVAGLDRLATLGVLLGVLLGLLDHAVDLVLAERRATGDGHRLLAAGRLVLGRDVHDAVGVDVEGDLDLRHAARGRREAGELEVAEGLVLRPHLALALGDLDLHRRLVVVGGGEDLRPLGGDGGVALDERGHHAALGLDAEGERGDVEEQHVLDLALEDTGLERGADGDDLVGVDALVGLLAAEELGDDLGDGRHAGRATDEDHVVDLVDRDAAVLEDVLERRLGALEQVGGELLELAAGQLLLEVQRAALAVGDVGQVDRGLGARGRELDLRLLRGLLEALLGDLVGRRGRRRCCP